MRSAHGSIPPQSQGQSTSLIKSICPAFAERLFSLVKIIMSDVRAGAVSFYPGHRQHVAEPPAREEGEDYEVLQRVPTGA